MDPAWYSYRRLKKEGQGDGHGMGAERHLVWRRRVPPACWHRDRARDGGAVDGGGDGGGGGGGCKALDTSLVIGPNEEATEMGRGRD